MFLTCEHCGFDFEVADNSFGCTIECFNCKTRFVYDQFVLQRMIRELRKELARERAAKEKGNKIFIRKDPSRYSAPIRPISAADETPKKNAHGCISFFLGLLFSLLGVVIAALIGGAGGALWALLGAIIWFVIFVVLFF